MRGFNSKPDLIIEWSTDLNYVYLSCWYFWINLYCFLF